MNTSKRYVLHEVCELLGVQQDFLVHSIRAHWVRPVAPENAELDEADLARLRLILDLQRDFGVNEEAIPVILHLLDQLYAVRFSLREGA